MSTRSTLEGLRQLAVLTEKCVEKGLAARRQALRYAHHYRIKAEEFRKQAAGSRFPETQERLCALPLPTSVCAIWPNSWATGRGSDWDQANRAAIAQHSKAQVARSHCVIRSDLSQHTRHHPGDARRDRQQPKQAWNAIGPSVRDSAGPAVDATRRPSV